MGLSPETDADIARVTEALAMITPRWNVRILLALAAGWTREATHSQVASALHVVIHLGRRRDGTRVLRELALPRRGADGLVSMESALVFDDHGATTFGPAADRLERER